LQPCFGIHRLLRCRLLSMSWHLCNGYYSIMIPSVSSIFDVRSAGRPIASLLALLAVNKRNGYNRHDDDDDSIRTVGSAGQLEVLHRDIQECMA
jgi:hypothetical protein